MSMNIYEREMFAGGADGYLTAEEISAFIEDTRILGMPKSSDMIIQGLNDGFGWVDKTINKSFNNLQREIEQSLKYLSEKEENK